MELPPNAIVCWMTDVQDAGNWFGDCVCGLMGPPNLTISA
jgi:hypothetical protein